MQYALTILEGPADFARREGPGAEAYWAGWAAYSDALRAAGISVDGAALQGPETATTIRVRDGKRTVHDGPYADSKEQTGGFMLLEAATLDEAIEWAARCPAASYAAVELRPVLPTSEQSEPVAAAEARA